MKNETKNRIIHLDFLRGACTLYIVGFWHMMEYSEASQNHMNFAAIKLMQIALGTFVFISGYFIGLNNLDISRHNVILFYKKSFLRIYPLYFFAIALYAIFHLSNLTTLIKAASMISMFAKPAPITLWFITMLMSFYIISPFIIVVCSTMHPYKFILYFFLLIGCLLTYSYLTELLDLRLVRYFPSFVLGIFLATNKNKDVPQNNYILYFLFLSWFPSQKQILRRWTAC